MKGRQMQKDLLASLEGGKRAGAVEKGTGASASIWAEEGQ